MLERHGLLDAGAHAADRPSAPARLLRVLPLGGLGEIGKNMTVVEYDGRIVVVDCGLRFPTAEMMGIDLVLPDFTYLRERVDGIEAIVITHGHEDHLGALPWVLRELGAARASRSSTAASSPIAMARSKLDEHKLRDVHLEVLPIGQEVQAGPFVIELVHLTHSIPDAAGVALALRARDDPRHRRLQVRPDAGRGRARRTSRGSPSSAATGCCCSSATRRTPTGPGSPPASRSSAPTSSAPSRTAPGRIVVTCFASNIHRVQQVVHAAAAARPQGRARRALDAQERQHRPHARPHRRARGASSSRRARSSSGPTTAS